MNNYILNSIRGVALDLDGTIYFGNSLIEGAIDLINSFHRLGINICYLTNNSTKPREEILKKLFKLGIHVYKEDLVITSAYATAKFVSEMGFRSIYYIGSQGLKSDLENEGISISDTNINAIVIGLDLDFNYNKLTESINVIKLYNSCPIIACNLDRTYPIGNKLVAGGCGSIVASLEYALDRKIDYSIGKPNTYMLEMYMRLYEFNKNEVIVIGDQYESDILMAEALDVRSILISNNLSFKTKLKGVTQFVDIAGLLERI